ncbi:MAG: DUF6596 domain-containing protein [Pseudomonadota bacterium]
MKDPIRAAELAARLSYGRLLAFLSARTHDITLAEDALSDAFAKALEAWPQMGVPGNPDAWLLTVARNRLSDVLRRQGRFSIKTDLPEFVVEETSPSTVPDERLSLLLVCAHPAINSDLHAPLMLQTVLGLDAASIARLFLISPTALSKRLVRAKAKIRDAGIPFQIPESEVLKTRSSAILEAIYALHAHDWLDPTENLGEEAFYLADLLARLLPDNAEALGLASLIAANRARLPARIVDDVLVSTEDQDTVLWDEDLIAYSNRQLVRAHQLGSVGRFQIEAAIEAVHIARKETGTTDWLALNKLYHACLQYGPTAGGLVAQAAVTGRLHGPEAGLAALENAEGTVGTAFQPLWAARADMCARLGQSERAARYYEKAISLTTDLPSINFLRVKLASVSKP